MSSASQETLAEVREARASLARVIPMQDSPEKEDDVWHLYAKCERLAATLKFRLRVERPGVFLTLPRSDEPDEFLPMALAGLEDAVVKLEAGDDIGGLESLRSGRTYLRAYLASKRRLRMRANRKASPSRPSS